MMHLVVQIILSILKTRNFVTRFICPSDPAQTSAHYIIGFKCSYEKIVLFV